MTQWLDRALTISAVHYCLCLSEAEMHKEMKRIKLPRSSWPNFLNKHANATAHFIPHNDKQLCFVCLGEVGDRSGIQVAALLVHEAVHIWQYHAELIGSFNDHGDEEEAYAIQQIAQQLMYSYADRLNG